MGRLKHFASITDPRLAFVSQDSLNQAKILLDQYKLVVCLKIFSTLLSNYVSKQSCFRKFVQS